MTLQEELKAEVKNILLLPHLCSKYRSLNINQITLFSHLLCLEAVISIPLSVFQLLISFKNWNVST